MAKRILRTDSVSEIQEVQKYLSITDTSTHPLCAFVKKHFDKHPADVKVLTDCGSSTQTLVYRKVTSLEVELFGWDQSRRVQVNNADNAHL